jgi:hypothetical protein
VAPRCVTLEAADQVGFTNTPATVHGNEFGPIGFQRIGEFGSFPDATGEKCAISHISPHPH